MDCILSIQRNCIQILPGHAGMKFGKPKLVVKWKLMLVIGNSQHGFPMGKSYLTNLFASVMK